MREAFDGRTDAVAESEMQYMFYARTRNRRLHLYCNRYDNIRTRLPSTDYTMYVCMSNKGCLFPSEIVVKS